MLALHPNLSVFGYTAHLPGTPIANALTRVINRHGFARFAMRTSGVGGARGAITVASADDAEPAGAIACPQQSGASEVCAKCALCWGTERAIAFVAH